MKVRYRITFMVEGRVRFLSHLETVDTLLSALRRAGVRLALSEGMKPKPLIQLALPRPVGVESWSELAEFELDEEVDVDVLANNLAAQLPRGMRLLSLMSMRDSEEKAAARRVAGATYRLLLDESVGREHADIGREITEQWVHRFLGSESIPIERVTPKQRRTVDVREFVSHMELVDSSTADGTSVAVRYYAQLTDRGSVKPDEVAQALAEIAGQEVRVARCIRESIALRDVDGRRADAMLVGADVPEGPAKPWGAC